MKAVRAIILFADIHRSTEFGYTQCLEMHNNMLRDFHDTCHKTIRRFRRDKRLAPDRVTASCRGDECCVFLSGGQPPEDELLAMNLAIYLKEMWKQSRFCRLNWKAARTGLIPQVDLRIGIGSGEVALDRDAWSDNETLEGIRISEAKRIEGMADAASDTLIAVKLDIMEACIQAGEKIEFGPRMRLQGKGVPDVVEVHVYPVKTYGGWSAIQRKVVPSPKTYFERLAHAMALLRSGDLEEAKREYDELVKLRPDDPDTLTNRGRTLHLLQRYEEALADLNRSLELRPDDRFTIIVRAFTLDDLQRYEESLANYDRALQIRPDDSDVLFLRGMPLYHLRRYDEALANYNRVLELRPEDFAAQYSIACLSSLLGRYDDALEWLKKAIDGDVKYRGRAADDEDFAGLRADPEFGPRFERLIQEKDP